MFFGPTKFTWIIIHPNIVTHVKAFENTTQHKFAHIGIRNTNHQEMSTRFSVLMTIKTVIKTAKTVVHNDNFVNSLELSVICFSVMVYSL